MDGRIWLLVVLLVAGCLAGCLEGAEDDAGVTSRPPAPEGPDGGAPATGTPPAPVTPAPATPPAWRHVFLPQGTAAVVEAPVVETVFMAGAATAFTVIDLAIGQNVTMTHTLPARHWNLEGSGAATLGPALPGPPGPHAMHRNGTGQMLVMAHEDDVDLFFIDASLLPEGNGTDRAGAQAHLDSEGAGPATITATASGAIELLLEVAISGMPDDPILVANTGIEVVRTEVIEAGDVGALGDRRVVAYHSIQPSAWGAIQLAVADRAGRATMVDINVTVPGNNTHIEGTYLPGTMERSWAWNGEGHDVVDLRAEVVHLLGGDIMVYGAGVMHLDRSLTAVLGVPGDVRFDQAQPPLPFEPIYRRVL